MSMPGSGPPPISTQPPSQQDYQRPTQSQQQQQSPYETTMPRFVNRANPQDYLPQTIELERGTASTMYGILWPTAGWCLAIFNFAVMVLVLFGMVSTYNPWSHGLTSLISTSTLAALAMIYKWILMAPDGPPRRNRGADQS